MEVSRIESLLFLWSLFGVALIFFKNKRYALIGLFIVIFVSIIRWDIGNDYRNYYCSSLSLAQYFRGRHGLSDIGIKVSVLEPTYQFIVYLFKDFKVPILGVQAVYSTLTLLLWYISLKRIDGLFWGFFAIFFTGALFLTWDQMRQGLAIAIFIFAIQYIDNSKPLKYFGLCLIAFLFHSSALVLFPMYLVKYLRISNFWTILIISVLFVGFIAGFWTSLFRFIFSFIDRYSHYMDNKMELQQFSSGLGLIARVLIYTTVVLLVKKKSIIVSNIIFVGLCIYLLSCSNELIERISTYGTFGIILALPIIMKNVDRIKYRTVLISLNMLIFLIGTYNSYKGVSGCIPYDTVFSDNFDNRYFRPRLY